MGNNTLRSFQDDKGQTLNCHIDLMNKAHPIVGYKFEIGVSMFENGYDKPNIEYFNGMRIGDQMLLLGWQMANKTSLLMKQ